MAGAWNSCVRVIHRRAHLFAWLLLGMVLPLILGAGLWQRFTAPAMERPMLLAPP